MQTQLRVEILRADDTSPTAATSTTNLSSNPLENSNPSKLPDKPINKVEDDHHKIGMKRPNPSTYAHNPGNRKSKRLRGVKAKESPTLVFTVARIDNVMDVKQQVSPLPTKHITCCRLTDRASEIQITDKTGIVPIQQRLYLHGVELNDNSATLEQTGVLAFDTLVLHSSNENEAATEDRNGDGEGYKAFGGSLLVGSMQGQNADSTSDLNLTPPPVSEAEAIHLDCPTCTFSNTPDAERCAMCDTLL